MKLFTKAILNKIPTLEATAETSIEDGVVICKFFNPAGAGTWYLTAYNPDQKLAFGFVTLGDPDMAELGYISITELESIKLPMGLSIERDMHFDPMPLKEVMDTITSGGHV